MNAVALYVPVLIMADGFPKAMAPSRLQVVPSAVQYTIAAVFSCSIAGRSGKREMNTSGTADWATWDCTA